LYQSGLPLQDIEIQRKRIMKKMVNLVSKKQSKAISMRLFDEDIEAIISEEFMRSTDFYKLVSANFSSGTDMIPVATVKVQIDGIEKTVSEHGDGPVDAAYKAISKATGETPKLLDYSVGSITGGTDALGAVNVRIEEDGVISQGYGTNTDIVIASAKAFVNALNKLRWRKEHPRKAISSGV